MKKRIENGNVYLKAPVLPSPAIMYSEKDLVFEKVKIGRKNTYIEIGMLKRFPKSHHFYVATSISRVNI